ncbi:reverse transcriptase domain-containing protein [Tanacetum coccineum]
MKSHDRASSSVKGMSQSQCPQQSWIMALPLVKASQFRTTEDSRLKLSQKSKPRPRKYSSEQRGPETWTLESKNKISKRGGNGFSKLRSRSIDGFEELRRAFRLNFTQRKKCAKNPVELARVKQRQGESTSAYVERYKDECIHVKACPEILKISGSFIQGEAAAADSRKGYSNNRSQEQSRRQSNDQSSSRNNSYRGQRGGRGNDKYTPLTMTPKEILATEGSNFPKPPPMRTPEEQRIGSLGEEHQRREKTKERGKKDLTRDKADTIYMVQSWQRKTKQKVSQKFSHGSGISFPTLTADNAVVEPLTIEINAAGHDIHRMYIDGGASADILYEHCFQRLRPRSKKTLHHSQDEHYVIRSPTHTKALFEGDQWISDDTADSEAARNQSDKLEGRDSSRLPGARVYVKKSDGSWRMCVDFTDLNKACPQDCYPLPEIDWKVESLCGYPFKCFLDAYKGYQTNLNGRRLTGKQPFTTMSRCLLLYKDPLVLRIGATYQRLVDNAFEGQVGRNLEVYVDDLVIKSHIEDELRSFSLLLKQHIAALPTLVAPRPGEELIIYLSATHGAISAVLLTDRDSIQTPVYFVSKALKETEINYSAMEKLILALVFAAKRLRRYFQAHPIAVITDQPIKQVISKPDASGRLQKWSVLLGEHNISYRPRTAVKGQILADFLIEKPETDAVLPQSEVKLQDPWILFTDGSSCVDGSGAGLILTNPEGMEFTYALRFEFSATNNEAEYEALIAGLRIAARMGVRNLEANVDSRLVANHVLGEYVAKEDNMVQYLDKTKSLIQGFDRFTIRQVPRGDNKKADALSKIASTSFAHYQSSIWSKSKRNQTNSRWINATVIEEQDPT